MSKQECINLQPLVSICIPTYNRCTYLKQVLDSYIQEKEVIAGKVEIVISDNASTDATETLAREYQKKYPHIRYFRNAENIIDRNFPLAMSRGNGVLRKLCNDTLQIRSGYLARLCNVVEKYRGEQPFLFFHNQGGDEERLCRGMNEFLFQVGHDITFIGSFSLWEKDCQDLADDTTDCELYLWQVRKTCQLVGRENPAVIVQKKIFFVIPVTTGKDVSYGLFNAFHNNLLGILGRYSKSCHISDECLAYVEKDVLYRFFTNLLIDKELKADKHLLYAKNENLKKAVWEAYRDKEYWGDYLIFYKHTYRRRRLINFIKKMLNWEKHKKSYKYQFLKNILLQICNKWGLGK